MVCMSFACSRFTGGHCWGCRSVMSCLACSLPRLVGLLGLFNSPYPSRTPTLSQWSDRPRRVGLGPQFLSRGSLTVRDSVVGRRFILCGCLSSTWCAHWDGILLTDCRGGHRVFVARPIQCMPLSLLQGRVPERQSATWCFDTLCITFASASYVIIISRQSATWCLDTLCMPRPWLETVGSLGDS